jgi:cell division inhibitor SulA
VTSPFKFQSAPAKSTSGVTELVLTSKSPEQLQILLPMLAFLSNQHENRWITWIAPEYLNRQVLEAYGVNTSCIRLIHCAPENLLWVTWEALASGTSNMVIASPGKLSEKELHHLETAAHKGQCQGLLLRARD